MVRLGDFEEQLRRVFSVFFRLIIIFFAGFIVFTSENPIPPLYYTLVFCAYFLLFFFVLRRNGRARVRLLVDFVFIFFVIYDRDSDNFYSLLIVLLPLINSPNHSGKKSSPFLVVLFTSIAFLYLNRNTTLFDHGIGYITVYLSIPFVFFFLILLFEYFRSKILRLNDRFGREIDKYFDANNRNLEKAHSILERIVAVLNRSRLITFTTERLIAIKIIKENLVVTRSSDFVFDFKVSDRNKYISEAKQRYYVQNWQIVVDGESKPYNLTYFVQSENSEFLFVLITKNSPLFLAGIVVQPVFSRLVKILTWEDALMKRKREYLDKLRDKFEFLEDAQMAMHFIKNKLSPVLNFVSISEDLQTLDGERKAEAYKLYEREREKIKINIPLIVDKAQRFHSRGEEVLGFSDVRIEKIQNLLTLIRDNWNTHFPDDDIQVNLEIEKLDCLEVELNEDFLDFLLTNWISNMQKYHNELKQLVFSETMRCIQVDFLNDFHERDRKNAESFVYDLNSDERAEVLTRGPRRRGRKEIKFFLKQLELDYNLVIDNKILKFSLYFNKKSV